MNESSKLRVRCRREADLRNRLHEMMNNGQDQWEEVAYSGHREFGDYIEHIVDLRGQIILRSDRADAYIGLCLRESRIKGVA